MAVFHAFKKVLIEIYKNTFFPLEGANTESDSHGRKGATYYTRQAQGRPTWRAGPTNPETAGTTPGGLNVKIPD